MAGVGAGTVRIGRRVVDDLGRTGRFGGRDSDSCEEAGCEVGLVRETVFVELGSDERAEEDVEDFGFNEGGGFVGRPEMVGGGRLRPSAALRESCRAKSDACHHSRNLSAKIEVGSRIFRLDNKRG